MYYQDKKAVFSIISADLIDGDLPSKQTRMVLAWVEIHKDELLADWNLCQNGEKPFIIEPLK